MLVHNAPASQSPTQRAFEPEQGGGWCLWLRDDAVRRFDAVVVAVGHDWCPKLLAHPGVFAGHTSQSHHCRAVEPFAEGRMLVVGGGSSAAEIAVEVAGVAERTCIRCDLHAYRRLLRADRRRAARRTLRPRLRPGSSQPLSRCRLRLTWAPATHESGRG